MIDIRPTEESIFSHPIKPRVTAESLQAVLDAPGAPGALVARVRSAAAASDERPWGSVIPYYARITFRDVSLQHILKAWETAVVARASSC